jgi:hypothetical protein
VAAVIARALLIAIALTIVARPAPVFGQAIAGSTLKAAFLYNFVKFVEWPREALADEAPLVLCVTGDLGVADALDEAVRGRAVDRHRLVVRRPKVDDSLRLCHVLYLSGVDGPNASLIVQRLAGAAVLTASDIDRFAQGGGVAHFFLEADRMRFAINLDAAQRARLKVSSKLLGLAKIVKDEAGASPH